MTDLAPTGPRRRNHVAFAPTKTRGPTLRWMTRLLLAVAPLILFLAHLTFGANQPAASLWFTALGALGFAVALVSPLRLGIYDLPPVLPLLLLFGLTLIVAAWTLTPWAPGGAHPIWEWAGFQPTSITIDRGATVLEITKLCGLASFFGLGALQGVNRHWALATLQAIVWLGGGYALISLLTFVAGAQIAAGDRLSGGFLSFNSGATIFGVLTILGLGLFLRGWQRQAGLGLPRRLIATAGPLACLALSAVCLFLTASRMGVTATLIATSALLFWSCAQNPNGKVPVISTGLLILILGSVLYLGGNTVLWSRLDGLHQDASTRSLIFSTHWQAFLSSPLFGYGLGSFNLVNLQIMTDENATALWSVRAAHNVYLQWLEEAGLVGAIPIFALIVLVIGSALWPTVARGRRIPVQALICANLVVLIHGATDYALQVPSIAAFWAFLLGLQFAFARARGG